MKTVLLALPLLLGGVTAGEFWRVVLALLVSLFLSLACGLFMSSITRESRVGMGGTFLFLFFTNAVLPLLKLSVLEDVKLSDFVTALLVWPSQTFLLDNAWPDDCDSE